jgi:cystathionine beta-lyase
MALPRLTIDFDIPVSRAGTASLKYDARTTYYGTNDVVPLWVADMDFSAPEAVTQALVKRATHTIYGYTDYPESLYTSMQNWFASRHDWGIDRDSIILCPGVVPSLYAAITALTSLGDQVIVQPPVYHPFFSAVTDTGRSLVENPLVLENGRYRMDLAHLASCAEAGAKLLVLCSPHNPVGRVWSRTELEALLAVARQYGLTIISDDIHADLIFPDQVHTPLATLTDDVTVITAVSPSKTFNIPGLGLSALVVNDSAQRQAIEDVFKNWHVSNMNPFSICGFEAAYNEGEAWLDELMVYLADTRLAVQYYLEEALPEVQLVESEGTYLLWLDCRGLGMGDTDLHRFLIEQAKIALSPGTLFGQASGSGFMRLNMAAPRAVILAALTSISTAFRALP